MASTEPIVRISRAEELSRRLEQEIVDNGLPAGERLGTKEDIRNRFGYAVATVNEALRLLDLPQTPQPWAAGDRSLVVRIPLTNVTGRRVHAS